jgi:hypothetical protein
LVNLQTRLELVYRLKTQPVVRESLEAVMAATVCSEWEQTAYMANPQLKAAVVAYSVKTPAVISSAPAVQESLETALAAMV